jgi:hypothetical protein
MKIIKHLLVLAGAVGLLSGCATSGDHAGAVGNQSEAEYGIHQDDPPPPAAPDQAPPQAHYGPNGSVSRGNPFGAGIGTGMTSVR